MPDKEVTPGGIATLVIPNPAYILPRLVILLGATNVVRFVAPIEPIATEAVAFTRLKSILVICVQPLKGVVPQVEIIVGSIADVITDGSDVQLLKHCVPNPLISVKSFITRFVQLANALLPNKNPDPPVPNSTVVNEVQPEKHENCKSTILACNLTVVIVVAFPHKWYFKPTIFEQRE